MNTRWPACKSAIQITQTSNEWIQSVRYFYGDGCLMAIFLNYFLKRVFIFLLILLTNKKRNITYYIRIYLCIAPCYCCLQVLFVIRIKHVVFFRIFFNYIYDFTFWTYIIAEPNSTHSFKQPKVERCLVICLAWCLNMP